MVALHSIMIDKITMIDYYWVTVFLFLNRNRKFSNEKSYDIYIDSFSTKIKSKTLEVNGNYTSNWFYSCSINWS